MFKLNVLSKDVVKHLWEKCERYQQTCLTLSKYTCIYWNRISAHTANLPERATHERASRFLGPPLYWTIVLLLYRTESTVTILRKHPSFDCLWINTFIMSDIEWIYCPSFNINTNPCTVSLCLINKFVLINISLLLNPDISFMVRIALIICKLALFLSDVKSLVFSVVFLLFKYLFHRNVLSVHWSRQSKYLVHFIQIRIKCIQTNYNTICSVKMSNCYSFLYL